MVALPKKIRLLPAIQEQVQPKARFIDSNPRYLKMMKQGDVPIQVSGAAARVPLDRNVVWKNVCNIGKDVRECIVEMSFTKTKFFIIAVDLESGKYHMVELFRP